MSKEITIKNSRWFKKQLNYEDIIEGTSFIFGGLDEQGRTTDYDGEDAVEQLIYDTQSIGRGVYFDVADGNKAVNLELLLPATEADFRVLYTVARSIASLWGAKSILLDDEEVKLTELDDCMENDFAISTGLLADFADKVEGGAINILCATLPISINSQQLTDFSNDYKAFGKYLHERQSIYPFYSIAIYVSSDSEKTVKYVAIADGKFVLPNNPQMTYHDGENSIEYDKAVIATPNLFKEGEIAEVDFMQFLSHVPDDKKAEFDCEHTLISPLSVEELQAIFSSRM